MRIYRPILALLLLGFAACSHLPVNQQAGYQQTDNQHLQNLERWQLDGRLALTDDKESISVSVVWTHKRDWDEIVLVGPLAQGRLLIAVSESQVIIDDGSRSQQYNGSVNDVVTDQLGVDMPVNALKYWVLGVKDPKQNYTEQQDGFYQNGWLVKYAEMQMIGGDKLQKKISATKDKTRIKLIVDQWDLL